MDMSRFLTVSPLNKQIFLLEQLVEWEEKKLAKTHNRISAIMDELTHLIVEGGATPVSETEQRLIAALNEELDALTGTSAFCIENIARLEEQIVELRAQAFIHLINEEGAVNGLE